MDKWTECVSKARKLVSEIKVNKMRVAELALSATEARMGGDRKSLVWKERKHKTLDDFAKEIGISNSALYDWIQIKRVLPQTENMNYMAAKDTCKVLRSKFPKNLPEQKKHAAVTYEETVRKMASPNATLSLYVLRVGGCLNFLRKSDIRDFPPEKVAELRRLSAAIVDAIDNDRMTIRPVIERSIRL